MARDRARTDPLSAESRCEVLRDGLRHVRTPEFIPYDETPWPLSPAEGIAAVGVSMSDFTAALTKMARVLARAYGKNHAAEQFKQLQRGMVIFTNDLNMKPSETMIGWSESLDLKIPKAKEFKQKRLRIPDHEPYYVKLTKPRRR